MAAASTVSGILFGALQGYFAGWTDIAMERLKEIWGSMPMLYMLIIFSSLFAPSFWLLVAADQPSSAGSASPRTCGRVPQEPHARLRARRARALGQTNRTIMWRHILPNSLTPVVTLVPFEIAASHRRAHQPRLPRPRRAARYAEPRRAVGPGQRQPRRLVDLALDVRRAGHHVASLDSYRRCLTGCAKTSRKVLEGEEK